MSRYSNLLQLEIRTETIHIHTNHSQDVQSVCYSIVSVHGYWQT